MITAGFEYGFQKKLNVVKTRPGDWEEKPGYDLGTYISQGKPHEKELPRAPGGGAHGAGR